MSINFDGTDDCIGIDNTPVINKSGYSATSYSFSISCWFKPDGRHNGGLFEQYDGSTGDGRIGLYMLSNGKFRFRYHNSYLTSQDAEISTSTTTWYHMVGFWEYGERGMYLNNVLFDSNSGGTDPHWTSDGNTGNKNSDHSNSALDFNIGKASAGSPGDTYYFNGEVAEFAVHGTKLTTGDVASLYAGASPLFIKSDQLLSYYPLGGPLVTSSTGTTDAFKDVIGGNNLTATSAPAFVETPAFYGTTNQSSSMFYPQTYIAGDSVPFSAYSAPPAALRESYSESNLTGDDVIAEITQANLRKQGRISVNSGGINFKNTNTEENELSPFIDRNKNFIVAENYISIMNNRLSKDDRQDQTDEIHGGGGDGNN